MESLDLGCHCLEFLMLEGNDQLRRAAFSGSCMPSPVLTFIWEFGIVYGVSIISSFWVLRTIVPSTS